VSTWPQGQLGSEKQRVGADEHGRALGPSSRRLRRSIQLLAGR
jgi:hypothetical protein